MFLVVTPTPSVQTWKRNGSQKDTWDSGLTWVEASIDINLYNKIQGSQPVSEDFKGELQTNRVFQKLVLNGYVVFPICSAPDTMTPS